MPAFVDTAQELLLQAALGGDEIAPQAWHQWTQAHDMVRDLESLDKASQRLLPLVGYNLNALSVSHPCAEQIKHLTRLEWARTRMLFKSLGEAVTILGDNGIEVLLIKGVPLALQYYPASGLRPMNDGDFLVRPDEFDAAVKVLLRYGWGVKEKTISSPAHHAAPFRNGASQEMDLHRFAFGECPFALQDAEFWQGAVPIALNGISAQATNATDTLFMCCVHSVHSPLRWIADAVLLLRGSEIDWQRLLQQAISRRLSLVTYKALAYLESWFDVRVPAFVLDGLSRAPVSWVERREYRAWKKPESYAGRMAIRYASYQRLLLAQPELGLTGYLQLLGNLNSRREIPGWILTRGWEIARSRFSVSDP